MIKTIKIPADIHRELKIYIAKNGKSGEGICEFAGFAIKDELKKRGHIFSSPKPKKATA